MYSLKLNKGGISALPGPDQTVKSLLPKASSATSKGMQDQNDYYIMAVAPDNVVSKSETFEDNAADHSQMSYGSLSKSGEELLLAQTIATDTAIDPWSMDYIGIPLQYFSTGLLFGGSVSILYPVLIVNDGASSSFFTAAVSIVTIFWSYKIFFGILSDCFPIFGLKRKPYITIGWVICALIMVRLVVVGTDIDAKNLVIMLTMANLCYVMADVAADGFMVWIAHREPLYMKGRMQTLIYCMMIFGRIVTNLIILFGFAGPAINCPGYQKNVNVACTEDEVVKSRNEFSEDYPDSWCYMKCSKATFSFGLSISQFAFILASVIVLSIPFYLRLNEQMSPRERFSDFIMCFWRQMQRRAAWQVILYSMISTITYGVINAAKAPANYVWLGLTTAQNQIMVILENVVILLCLNMIRKYALHMSWRKMIFIGSLFATFFNLLYYIVVFDVWRNAWFYVFTDVSVMFMFTINFMASHFCIVEIAEPGFESITYSLITTASNAVRPLSSVISYQILAFFPDLNSQQSIATDTTSVRNQFALLHIITILINLSALFSLPMLPRQRKETHELVAAGETSSFWGLFALISALTFLIYSTIVTFVTVAGKETHGCYKILGGEGCSEDESSVPVVMLVGSVLLYCYGVNFYLSFWPILRDGLHFSVSLFI